MAFNCIKDQNGFDSNGKENRSGTPTSQIPVAIFSKRTISSENNFASGDRWRTKFEEGEEKRKKLIYQFEKAERGKQDIERKNSQLIDVNDNIMRQLDEKEKELTLLRKLAKEMFKEYDQLKTRYDLDTGALNQAIQRASKWYKQNRELKRKSSALVSKVMQISPNAVLDIVDEPDSGDDEIENLRQTVTNLNNDIARLQVELSSAKLQEFEAQETAMELQASLEEERKLRISLQQQVDELTSSKENLGQVTRLVAQEVSTLREQYQREKETAEKHKSDAQVAQRERNILVHQSQLLLGEVSSDEKLMKALLEIEHLKRSLEEEKELRLIEVQNLNEKIDEQETEADTETLQQKLKILESELDIALQRAQRAEKQSEDLYLKVSQLEEKKKEVVPPPPPPLPPSTLMMPGVKSISKRGSSPKPSSPVNEMASLLGLKRSAKPTLQPGAIDEIINQIKGGRFTLKTPERKTERIEEEPPAVKEMMNVLGTLKRRPGNRTPSFRGKPEMVATQNITI